MKKRALILLCILSGMQPVYAMFVRKNKKEGKEYLRLHKDLQATILEHDDTDLAQLLGENAVDFGVTDTEGNTLLHYAVMNGHYKAHITVLRLFLNGAKTVIDQTNQEGLTPLTLAALSFPESISKNKGLYTVENYDSCTRHVPTLVGYAFKKVIKEFLFQDADTTNTLDYSANRSIHKDGIEKVTGIIQQHQKEKAARQE